MTLQSSSVGASWDSHPHVVRNDPLARLVLWPGSGRSGLTSSPVSIIRRRQGLALRRKGTGHAEEQERATAEAVCWDPGCLPALPSWHSQAVRRGVPTTPGRHGHSIQLAPRQPWQNPLAAASTEVARLPSTLLVHRSTEALPGGPCG